jgi:hypothetical protein
MRRFRVSIAGLMVVVLFVAVGVAALRQASEIWSGVLFALTVGAMAFAGLRAAYRREAKRAFWAGFAGFGSIYLVLAFAPGGGSRPALVTQGFLTWLHPKIARQQPAATALTLTRSTLSAQVVTSASWVAPGGSSSVVTTDFDGDGTVEVMGVPSQTQQVAFAPTGQFLFALTTLDPTAFVRVGHCLIALLVAMLGGGVARWQWATGTRGGAPVAAPMAREEPPCPDAAS